MHCVAVLQAGLHFEMNFCNLQYAKSGSGTSGLSGTGGNKEMLKQHPGGKGYVWNLDIEARYVHIICEFKSGYYQGTVPIFRQHVLIEEWY